MMRRILLVALVMLSPVLTAPVHGAEPAAAEIEFFEKRIRPVLVDRCYECHSAGAKKLKGNLRLDARSAMLTGGDTGPAIVPGDVEKSLLIAAIRHADNDLAMPPKEKLPAEQIADFEMWIKRGAAMPAEADGLAGVKTRLTVAEAKDFWSLKPVADPQPPAVKQKDRPRSAIDAFILAQLEAKNLSQVGDADRRTLIRRATFDLTGLPPTPAEVDAFLSDSSATPEAFRKVVDRLLASPQYGERWGRHWMDLVRYADTAGDNSDYPIPQAYRYRNYIIDSFNSDKPYDRFVREQIAGDLLPYENWDQRNEQVIATGYVAMSRRFGSVVDRYPQHLTIEDTLDNMGKTFLGLSISCARCHDHKFDPITQADYYGLYGIFESTRYAFPGIELLKIQKDFIPLSPPEETEAATKHKAREKELDDAHNKLLKQRTDTEAALDKKKKEHAAAKDDASKTKLSEEIVAIEGKINGIRGQIRGAAGALESHRRAAPKVETAYGVQDGKPVDAKIHLKGEPEKLGAVVPRRFIGVLGNQALPKDAKGSGRLQLAQWISSKENPLFARVMVNRIWQHHFGRGLVATPSDFGFRGVPPSHPELLDHLASRFIESGFSIKAMHRLIMNSRVYQLASTDDNAGGNQASDPSNVNLWRFNRQRLDAESLRDSVLFISGSLDLSPMTQPHPFPPQEKWGFTQHYPFKDAYPSSKRSVYLMTRRLNTLPFFVAFDGADHNTTTPARGASVTTVQALYMLNDEFVHEQAGKLAERVLREAAENDARLDLMFKLALSRSPREEERAALKAFRDAVTATIEKPQAAEKQAWASLARVVLRMNEFMYVD